MWTERDIKAFTAVFKAVGAEVSPRIDAESGELVIGSLAILEQDDGNIVINREVLVRGVRYYPDGSGEPDTADMVEVAVIPANQRYRVYATAALDYAENAIACALEVLGEEEWARIDAEAVGYQWQD